MSETQELILLLSTFRNTYLSDLTQSQKTQLEMILKEAQVKEKDTLWKIGDESKFAFIIAKGSFKFFGCKEAAAIEELHTGAVVGEMAALLNESLLTTCVKAVTDGTIYVIQRQECQKFLRNNPGLLVLLAELKYFE